MTARRRPPGVWIISTYYLCMFVLSYLLLFLALSHSVPMPAEITALAENRTALEWVVLVIQSFIALSGAIALFFLRKMAYYLFGTGFVIGLGWIVWHSLTLMAATGMLILLAAILYTRKLSKQGTLT